MKNFSFEYISFFDFENKLNNKKMLDIVLILSQEAPDFVKQFII